MSLILGIYTIDMDMSVLKIEEPPSENEKEVVDRFEKVESN
jgi:hypothetical protein